MRPPIPLTDPRFVYVPAAQSDIRKTFARVRAELDAAKPPAPMPANVRPITLKGAA